MSDKFNYNEGDILISDSQCDLCVYRIEGDCEKCQKYEKKLPEVLTNDVLCPHYTRKGKIEL